MAGSVTTTTAQLAGGLTKYTLAWVSDASGDVSGNAVTLGEGELQQVTFIPDGGATQPENEYDVTLLDADSVDVLGGVGANLSNAAAGMKAGAIGTYFRPYLEAGS
jgi:hypothetical protein